MSKDFPGAFAALKTILEKQADGLTVLADTSTDYILITAALGPNGKPLWFGAVRRGKSAVSYHLMPLYYNPRLKATLTPELGARMQGKTCFNFQRPDADLFRRLDDLTKAAREQWARAGFLEPGPVPAERFAAALRESGEDVEAIAARRRKVAAASARKRAATRARVRATAGGAGPSRAAGSRAGSRRKTGARTPRKRGA